MTLLQSLKVVASKRPQHSPVQHRRNKLIQKLDEQIDVAKSLSEGFDLVIKRKRTVKNKESGEVFQMEQDYRLKPWWFTNDDGKAILELRYGNKRLEIGKGKTGIEIDSADKIVQTLDLLKRAVVAGELDEAIQAAVGNFGRKIKRL